jgi:hypothetical protein
MIDSVLLTLVMRLEKFGSKKKPNVTFSEKDSNSKSMHTFKFGITVDMHDIQSNQIIAENLVSQAISTLKSVSNEAFTSYITTESIVMGSMWMESAGIDNCLTSYYTGHPDLNPPDIKAWFVLRGTFPNILTGKEYIIINGEESLWMTNLQ